MLRKIAEKYNESGLPGMLRAFVARLPGVGAVCVYYVYRLSLRVQETWPPSTLYRIAKADPKEALGDLVAIQPKPEIFKKRFDLNHFCFIAYAGHEAVAYLWGQEGPVHVEQRYGFQVPVAKNQLFYYDSYTRPQWRQKGILRSLLHEMSLYGERSLRIDEIVAIIEMENLASQAAHERVGFLKDRLELFIEIGGRSGQVKLNTYSHR